MKEARLPKANVSDMVHCNNSFLFLSWSHGIWSCSSHRMRTSPLLSGLNGRGLVILPALGNVVGEGVVGIGSA